MWCFVALARAGSIGTVLWFSGTQVVVAGSAFTPLVTFTGLIDVMLAVLGIAFARRWVLRERLISMYVQRAIDVVIGLGAGTFGVAMSKVVVDANATGMSSVISLIILGYLLFQLWIMSYARSTLIATSIGMMVGAIIGSQSIELGISVTLLTGLAYALVRYNDMHSQEQMRDRVAQMDLQQRALALMREFEQTGRGWFWETDRRGNLVYLSSTVSDKLGVANSKLMGKPFTDLIRKNMAGQEHEKRTLGFALSTRTPFTELTVLAAIREEERWWSISGNPISNELGHFIGFRGSGSDLTEMKKSEREINQLARYDTLTGLANRLHINELLERSLRNHFGQPQACALFLLDLDRFKAVNDTLGHPVGDQLLQQVAGRLKHVVGDRGHVGRLGGDEFQVVFPQLTNRELLSNIGNEIIINMAKPFAIENEQVRIGSSIGCAIAEGEPTPASALVRNADLALYAAKDDGRGVLRFYADAMHDQASERKAIEDALRDALAQNQLELQYQPIVDINSQQITGFEALIRWNHPTIGVINPSKFIPIAEESNLIVPIGDWIIRTACAAVREMGPNYRIAVNVSPRQFSNPTLQTTIVNAIAASGIRQNQLELEITEGVFLEENEENQAAFRKLQALGVRFALDDFGTGYSALGYLQKMTFNKIKIDQSFVRGAARPGSINRAIITSIVSLANALGMETTAEGVETHDELEMIRALGCSHIQGFIYGASMPLDAALELLRNNDGKAVAQGFRCARETRRRTFRPIALTSGGYRYEGIIRNVSSRGALIEGLYNVPDGTRFDVELTAGLTVRATTRWSIDKIMGVEFDEAIDSESLVSATDAMRQQAMHRLAS